MFVIIAYDVQVTSEGGAKRLRRIAKECVNYGQRVQNSVFEVNLEYGKFLVMKDKSPEHQINLRSPTNAQITPV